MSAAWIRFVAAAILLCGWLGWLGWLAFTATDPIILSRPQFLVADAWVLARVEGDEFPSKIAAINEVTWIDKNDAKLKEGAKISIRRLDLVQESQNWRGPGVYVLPLSKSAQGGWELTRIPISPGYRDPPITDKANAPFPRLRIYFATDDVRAQLSQFKMKWKTE